MGLWHKVMKVVAGALASAAVAVGFATPALAAEPTTFNYTGSVQTFTAPAAGTYKIECWGAQGGDDAQPGGDLVAKGGKGGYASGLVTLSKGQSIYVSVGGSGENGHNKAASETAEQYGTAAKGGWNGGGNAGLPVLSYTPTLPCGSGGGGGVPLS